ncbi:EamA family transporter RarD [Thermoleptolyngbya oregonensis NK1-22]|uniref:EamA family transporter RarD n=1 Tax=Thermoleptolyngbya oregonensis NK1-22 TaxID=2547457 RepID=A0AA97BAZ3_9CYAN|nr:EamA family transporter RarD [Thermoleptolyngbya oregonensis NK1-22]
MGRSFAFKHFHPKALPLNFVNPKPSLGSVSSRRESGLIYALLAYTAWGLLPIYWKAFGSISSIEVLSHRFFWSAVFLISVLIAQDRRAELQAIGRSPRTLGILLITALLLAFNWGLYIYGVNSDRVVETSLGYFINPLVSVLLGFVVLKERLHWGQQLAVALATLGVIYFIWQLGTVPWIALFLAFSFALYGLVRKIVPVSPVVGLTIEALWVSPAAILFISFGDVTGTGHFSDSLGLMLLFMGCGIVTSFPLLWFNNAAKRLQLSTLGFMQYLAPSLQLLLGVFLYREPFTPAHAVTFGCIWLALLIYSATSWLRTRTQRI